MSIPTTICYRLASRLWLNRLKNLDEGNTHTWITGGGEHDHNFLRSCFILNSSKQYTWMTSRYSVTTMWVQIVTLYCTNYRNLLVNISEALYSTAVHASQNWISERPKKVWFVLARQPISCLPPPGREVLSDKWSSIQFSLVPPWSCWRRASPPVPLSVSYSLCRSQTGTQRSTPRALHETASA